MMLLRRITKHVKDQNWFAIVLDFVIVVAGVFMGIQAQQWVADRDQIRKEAIYLERLHGEVLQAVELRAGNVAHRYRVITGLNSADQVLFDSDSDEILSENECDAIAMASVMSQVTADLPTLTELLSAGRLDTLSSTEVRTILIGYVQQQNRQADALAAITSGVSALHQAHPSLIELRSATDITRALAPFIALCDTTGMKKSRTFLNDFVSIRSRYSGYVTTIETASDGLERLHKALDTELGFAHEPESKP